jgi:hypothetical protein
MRLGLMPLDVADFNGVKTGPSFGEAQVWLMQFGHLPLDVADFNGVQTGPSFGEAQLVSPGSYVVDSKVRPGFWRTTRVRDACRRKSTEEERGVY